MAPYLFQAVAVLGGLASLSAAAPNGVPEKRQINVPKVVPAVSAAISSVIVPAAQKTTFAAAVPAVAPSVVVPVAQVTTVPVAPVVNSIVSPAAAAVTPLTTILNPVTVLMTTINPGSSVTTVISPSSGAPLTTIITEHSPTTIIDSSIGSSATTIFASGPASVNALPSLSASASGSASAGLTIMPGVNATTIMPIGGGPATTAISAVISGVTTTLMQTGPATIIVNATQTIPPSMLSSALTVVGTTTITPIATIPVVQSIVTIPTNLALSASLATPCPTDLANSIVGQVTSQLNAGVPAASVVAQASSALAQNPALASSVAAAIPGALTTAIGASAVPTNVASVVNAITSNVLPAATNAPLATSLANLITSQVNGGVAASSIVAQVSSALVGGPGSAGVQLPGAVNGANPEASSVIGMIASELSAGVPASSIFAQVTSILGNNPSGAADLPGALTSLAGGAPVPSEAVSLVNQITSEVLPTGLPVTDDPLAMSLANLATSELSAGIPISSIANQLSSVLGNNPAVSASVAADLPNALTSALGGNSVPTEAASLINQITSNILPTSLPIDPFATSLANLATSELSAGIPISSIANQVSSILGNDPAASASVAADLPNALTSALGGNSVPTEAASLVNQITSEILPTGLPVTDDSSATSLVGLAPTSALGGEVVPTEAASLINQITSNVIPTTIPTVIPSAVSLGAPGIQTPAGCPAVGGVDATKPTSIALQVIFPDTDGSSNGENFVNVASDGALNSAPATSASPFQFTNIAGGMDLALAGSPAANGTLPAAYLDTGSSGRAPRIVIRYSDPSGLGPVVFSVDDNGMLAATNAASGLNTLALDAAGNLVLTSTSNTPTGIRVISVKALAASARVVAVPDPNATLNLPGSVALPTTSVLVVPTNVPAVPAVPTTFATQAVSVGPVQTVPVETVIPIAPVTPTVAVPTVPGYAAPI